MLSEAPMPFGAAGVVALDSTVMLTVSLPESPPESSTLAVMVWFPTLSDEVEKEAPVPIWPSRFEVHTSDALMLPSSLSLAVPEKLTVSPWVTVEPLDGEPMVAVGAVLTGPPPPPPSAASRLSTPPVVVTPFIELVGRALERMLSRSWA